MKRIISCLLFLCVWALSGLGCQRSARPRIEFSQPAPIETSEQRATGSQRPLFIAVASVLSPSETISAYRQIAQHIGQETGRQTSLIQRKTYAEVNLLLANGDVDLAFLSTGAYSAYRGMNEVEILVMAEHGRDSAYTPEIIVHADSKFRTLKDLQGKVFAFTDPLSLSGHMVIVDALRKQGTVPEKYFQRYFYTYSHDKAIWAVANRIADGASLDDQMLAFVRAKNPGLIKDIRVISWLPPEPTGPVVISKNLPPEQKEQMRQIFLHMHEHPRLEAAINQLVIDRFVRPKPQAYAALRELYGRTSGLP